MALCSAYIFFSGRIAASLALSVEQLRHFELLKGLVFVIITGVGYFGFSVCQLKLLRSSELSYRLLFEAAKDGILILEADTGRVSDVNPFLVELLGFSHSEMVGKTVGELGPLRDIVSNQAMLERLQQDGYVRYDDLPLETRDGRKIAVEFVCNVYQVDGKKVIQCNIRNVTKRQQAEMASHRLAAIVERSNDAIISKDLNGIITSWNKAAEKIFGYSADEMVGASILQLLPADRRDEENQILGKITRGESVEHFETLRKTKDGRLIDVSITVSPIQDATGKIVGVSKVARDITERKQAEDDVRQLSGHLLRSQDDERRRIGRELHDSTAQELVAVALNLGLVQQRSAGRDATADNLIADSQAIIEQCQRELRTLAYELHPPVLDDMGLVGAVQEYAAGFTQRSGIKVKLDASPALGRLPAETERALFRVVQENLGNVRRHSGSPTATVRIKGETAEVILEVSDQGRGLRLRRDGTVLHAGVGLAGMRERVRQLGGRFEIEASGRGTTVRAIVPRLAGVA